MKEEEKEKISSTCRSKNLKKFLQILYAKKKKIYFTIL